MFIQNPLTLPERDETKVKANKGLGRPILILFKILIYQVSGFFEKAFIESNMTLNEMSQHIKSDAP